MLTCDFWECKNREECIQAYGGVRYRPCPACSGFDSCTYCAHYIECCDLVVKYLPNMFCRLVREIRHGENLEQVQQYIRRNTHGGKRGG